MRQRRRFIAAVGIIIVTMGSLLASTLQQEQSFAPPSSAERPLISSGEKGSALRTLDSLPIKGRAPKTGYSRAQFGSGWQAVDTCDMRNYILARDLEGEMLLAEDDCRVRSGILHDPYSGKTIQFVRGAQTSDDVQIDHVVALSDAWQKGAQLISPTKRHQLANDPLNLLAVDGPTNNQKSDSDAASWLPPNKSYRCQYVARQIAVKQTYELWVTQAEHDAIGRVLAACPSQALPVITTTQR